MLLQFCIHKPTLRCIKFLDINIQFCFPGNTIYVYLKICGILAFLLLGNAHNTYVLNINELSVMKRQSEICYSNKCQICLSKLSITQAF